MSTVDLGETDKNFSYSLVYKIVEVKLYKNDFFIFNVSFQKIRIILQIQSNEIEIDA